MQAEDGEHGEERAREQSDHGEPHVAFERDQKQQHGTTDDAMKAPAASLSEDTDLLRPKALRPHLTAGLLLSRGVNRRDQRCTNCRRASTADEHEFVERACRT